jgi:uroporphyrinogen decarboxylase
MPSIRSMTSREILKRAIHFRRPPRLPVNFWAFGVSDTAGIPIQGAAGFKPSVEGEDEWGCVWSKTDLANMGQVKGHPLESSAGIDNMKFPDHDDDSRYAKVPESFEKFDAEGRYVQTGIFMVLFERMHSLYGFENVLCDLLTDRPAMEALADRVVEVHLCFVDNIGRRFGDKLQGIGMSDDWGTQEAAFISFDLWMDFFFPRYKRLFDRMHHYGYDVWVHSCGKVNEIVEGYIKAGVNVVNLQQPRALGIEEMGKRYRGRITFESLADIQATLPTNDRAKVDADVAALAEHWMSPEGGFIFSDYGDDAAIGVTDPGIKRHMYRKFSEASERIYGEPLPEPKE